MAYPQELPLKQLALASNYRTTFHPQEIAEMIISCRALVGNPPKPRGIVEPLIVRPRHGKAGKPEMFEIVCGGKRFRAATDAELPTVPVRVVEIADEEVVEFQLIENLIRSNPHPMQEAEGFHALLSMHKDWNADHIAERVGRDRSYVYKRLQFMELVKPAQLAFREDRISIGHALEISRLPQTKQLEAFGRCFATKWDHKSREYVTDPRTMKGKATESVADLREWIRSNVLCELSGAPWDKSDANLVPKAGPCITCPKHTGANAALFEDLAKKGDKCLDSDCFAQKRQAFVQLSIDAAPEMPRITLGYEAPPKGILARSGNGYQLVEKGHQCKSAQPAIVAAGDKQVGHKVLICLDKDCKTHGSASSSRSRYGGGPKTPQEIAADKRKRLELKIREATQRAVLKAIAETEAELISADGILFVCDRVIERIGHDNRRELCAALGLEGIKRKHYNGADFEKPLQDYVRRTEEVVEFSSFLVAALACNAFHARPGYGASSGRLNAAAKAAGVDLKKLTAIAAKPLQEKAARAKANAAKAKAAKKKTPPAAKAKTAVAK